MHVVTIQRICKKEKKVLEEKQEKFYSIYNAERRASEVIDYNIVYKQAPDKFVVKIDKMAA